MNVASNRGKTDDAPEDPKLSGIARCIVAVRDAGAAAVTYGKGLGLAQGAPELDEERGVLSATCTPPAGGKIEFVSPVDLDRPFARRIAGFLDERREGMYALVLQAQDPEAAADLLEERGVEIERTEVIEAAVFGARLHIEKA